MSDNKNGNKFTKRDFIIFICVAYVVFIYLFIFLKISFIE
jgi:hypothetical protein